MYSTGCCCWWCCCQWYIVNTSINGCAVKQYEGVLSWSHHVVFQSERLSTFEVMAIHLFVAKTLYWDIWCVLLLLPVTPQLPVFFCINIHILRLFALPPRFILAHYCFWSLSIYVLAISFAFFFIFSVFFFTSLKFSLCTSFRSVSVCYVIFHSASLIPFSHILRHRVRPAPHQI